MLKADMHMHSIGDPEDYFIEYSPEELVDYAARQSFDVLSISCHGKVLFSEKLRKYASQKGILLIPGAEAYIEKKHVLIYDITQKELERLKTFDDLRSLKKRRKDVLVVAPHPYFPLASCLGDLLVKHIDVFDAVEISHLYLRYFDLNRKAFRVACKYGKPLIALSDTHFLWQFGKNYTLVNSKKSVKSFLSAIKDGKVRAVHKPMLLHNFMREVLWVGWDQVKSIFRTRKTQH